MSEPYPSEDRFRLVRLVPYDPAWPRLFAAQQARIRDALGPRALAVEHVGSTAVPGLAAKPVIDIHLTVRASAAESEYCPQLERAGYRLTIREPEWFEHRMFKGAAPEVNLHVFSPGCPELERCLLFRDWLRTSDGDRALYARVKEALAARAWERVQDYADAKTDVIAEIMARARQWKSP
jgi:GrpB-like predicted nucleotidyltransferase (UPF0157 family)